MLFLLHHLEQYFGLLDCGWYEVDGEKLPFPIWKFNHGPADGTVAFTTAGLSEHPLPSSSGGEVIRHELVIFGREDERLDLLPAILVQVGETILRAGRALLYGDVLGPCGPIIPGSELTAFYVTGHAYMPDSFNVVHDDQGEHLILLWLIPITDGEAAFCREQGAEKFEAQIARVDPDFLDWDRPSFL